MVSRAAGRAISGWLKERVDEDIVKMRMHLVAIRAVNLMLAGGKPLPRRAPGPLDMTLPRKPMHALRCFDRFATDKLWITRWTLVGKARHSITLKNLQLVRLIKVRVLTSGLTCGIMIVARASKNRRFSWQPSEIVLKLASGEFRKK